jgi:hypothetical protein
MSELNYCANGCTTRHGDTHHQVTTEGKSQLCNHCEDRLHTWLTKIPDHYALLPTFLEHGTVDRNPDSKATKAVNAGAPMRLDIVDLLDTRRGRTMNGLAPTTDRRGVIGTLKVHVERLCEERPLTTIQAISVTTACNLLDRHRLWLAEQDWIADLYDDIRILHRNLSDAIGEYRRPPVGACHLLKDDSNTACGGGLYANPYGGVRCTRCGATWDAAHLRQLGLAQAQDAG